MPKLNLNDRPVPSGSCEERLAPKLNARQLNAKLPPRLPSPLVRETSTGSVRIEGAKYIRSLAGLPQRFLKD